MGQSEYHNFFVDIDRPKLTVFCLNRYQSEDLNKTVGVIDFCVV